MSKKIAFIHFREGQELDGYHHELSYEIQTRLQVAINQTDGQRIQDLLIETMEKWEAINERFLEHKLKWKDPEDEKAAKAAWGKRIKEALQVFAVPTE